MARVLAGRSFTLSAANKTRLALLCDLAVLRVLSAAARLARIASLHCVSASALDPALLPISFGRLLPAWQSLPALALAAIMAFCPQDARMSQTPADSSALKPCPRCGQPAELVKAGSRRFWVQCSRYPKQGTCSTIAAQADNKKEAIHNWNSRM